MTQAASRDCIGVIGAGITGLTTAYRLLRAGYDVILLESTLHAGGMVASFTLGKEPIEYIYHHVFTSDNHVTGLAGELGLDGLLSWHPSREAIYSDGRLYPFSTPLDLMRFKSITPPAAPENRPRRPQSRPHPRLAGTRKPEGSSLAAQAGRQAGLRQALEAPAFFQI